MVTKARVQVEDAGASDAETQAAMVTGERIVMNHKGRKERRPVVATIEDNLKGKGDFYHPTYGWLRPRGIKEKDDPEGEEREFMLYEPSVEEMKRLERETAEDRLRARMIEQTLEGDKY